MQGKVAGRVFRSENKGKNPDTLERDHATLIVNRQDDVFASKRNGETAVDEMKCKRRPDISSTARLFPARPSRDINDFEFDPLKHHDIRSGQLARTVARHPQNHHGLGRSRSERDQRDIERVNESTGLIGQLDVAL
jgi:hypothetical protein